MTEKIFVLGSNSFSGSSFAQFALREGLDVVGISRSLEPDPVFLPCRWLDAKNFKFYQLDLNHDLNQIMALICSEKPRYVINFAAQSMVAQSWEFPDHWMKTNVVSTIQFHDRLRKCDFLKKYVHVSTPEVYGHCNGYIKESTSYNPSTPYAVSRAAADLNLMAFFNAYQFPVVFTRAANVYGAGQQLYRIIPKAVLSCRLGKKIELHGGGLSTRSFIHMKDVSEATWKIAQNGPAGEIYHIATSNTISIRDLVRLICDKLGVNFEDHVEVSGERMGKDGAYLLNSEKVKSELDWSDKISLETGIEEVVEWVDRNIEVLKSQPLEYIHKP